MAIELNHTVVLARDKLASARFIARIFGLPFEENEVDYFAPVRVNHALILDFVDSSQWIADFASSDRIPAHHYAFKVSEAEFDAIFNRVKDEGIPYGSGPPDPLNDMKINHRGGGRGVYFRDPDGHILELLTAE
jgi:catechol 2,3-dioxygenase-like lactoylglutathione lyase family enzyme